MNNEKLTNEDLIKYSRHLALPEIGKEGQEKLKQAKVLIVGAGGLGSPAAIYLAAAGIGTIGIIDFDKVEESNIQRQILYNEEDIGKSKVEIAANKIKKINKNVEVVAYNEKLTPKNALEIIKNYDIVIDGSDNFHTKYLVSDACVLLNKPNIYGSVFRFDGQSSVFNYNGPCFRCLFPNPPPKELVPNCADAGVLGVLPGVIGTIQATEAIKIILKIGDTLSGKLLVYNALRMSFKKLNLSKNKNCNICGENPTIKELVDYEQLCDPNSIKNDEISVKELKTMMDENKDFVLIDVREKIEWDICKIDRAELISSGQLMNENFLDNVDKNKLIIMHCHTGRRSAGAVQLLKDKGYKNVKNLVGGIDAWSKEIDQKVPIY